MAEPLTLLQHRINQPWLIGIDPRQLTELTEAKLQEFNLFAVADPKPSDLKPSVLLLESDPLHFLASFLAACTAKFPVFLGNPYWADDERQRAVDLAQPALIVEKGSAFGQTFPQNAAAQPGWIMIPTGGSSGQIRFTIHLWETLTASVDGLRQYFQVDRVNSCCVLPLYHVSGLMQFLRSLISGGKLVMLPSKALETGRGDIDPGEFFLSLVPTQLQRLLQNSASMDWLSRFHTVFLGGAPAWAELLETARHHQIRLAPTYGMTETASQVVTLKPKDFLQGKTGCGQVLPHAQVTIHSQTGERLKPGQVGAIAIQAHSLTLGYYPQLFAEPFFQTDDLGFFDQQGYLHVVGRQSQKIITGGENVFPAEVEAAIRASGLVVDVCIIGLPDPNWGEIVTAVYVPADAGTAVAVLQAALEQRLSKFKHPKCWIPMTELPRNAQGKVNTEQLRQTSINYGRR